MFTLVIGGAASGKSEYAEGLATACPGPRVYIATMEPQDGECVQRIEKHRNMRMGKGFSTVERYLDLSGAEVPPGAAVLLECVSNLVANELYSPRGGGADSVLRGVDSLLSRCAHLIVVTNEVFSGGTDYAEGTLDYLRALAQVNRALAALADSVVEVAAGRANVLKGAVTG